ncbi:DNA cytosine methyltransferase [Roseibium sp. RP-7]
MMRAIELFCGAGGMSLGLKDAGIRIMFAYDNWSTAERIYRANHKADFARRPRPIQGRRPMDHFRSTDLADVISFIHDHIDYPVDMICGGPPCQDFSKSGNQIEGSKARMTIAFATAVALMRPQWVMMENVRGALKSVMYGKARKIFKSSGYGLTEVVLNAAHYGVPQNRERLIVIGRLGERDGFLACAIKKAASKKPTTLRDVFGTGIGVHPGKGYPEDARAVYLPRRKGRTVLSIDEPCLTIISSAREPRSKDPEEHGPRSKNGKPDYASPKSLKPITFREMARIQGFPDDYDWAGVSESRSAGALAVANAVPPPLAAALGRIIKDRDDGKTIPEIGFGFNEFLRDVVGLSDATRRNRKSQLNRARRMLSGRTFSNSVLEIAALKATIGYRALPEQTQSDLKKALKLYAEWQDIYLPRQAKRASGLNTLNRSFKSRRFPKASAQPLIDRYVSLFDAGDDDALRKTQLELPWAHEIFPLWDDGADRESHGEADMQRFFEIKRRKRELARQGEQSGSSSNAT